MSSAVRAIRSTVLAGGITRIAKADGDAPVWAYIAACRAGRAMLAAAQAGR